MIKSSLFVRAHEHLGRAERVIQVTTLSTRLGGIGFIAHYHFAPGVLLTFEQESLFETIVAPRDHGPRDFASDLALITYHHLPCLKRRQKYHTVVEILDLWSKC